MQEINITLPYKFVPRDYQLPMYRELDSGRKRVVKCWHRRAGKDVADLNYMIKEMVRVPENYWYLLPGYGQGRKAIWENKTKDGFPYLGFFPPELVKKIRQNDMMIEMKNGSIFRVLGADDVDRIVGAGPRGVVLSEYSLHKPTTWQYIEPMILEKDGWAIFNGTPRGENHFHELLQMAQNNPAWFSQICTIRDTGVISEDTINQLREAGRPEEIIQQEFYCSFKGSIHGAYYGAIMDKLENDGRITDDIGYDPAKLVHTAWDLGKSDSNAIWFWQFAGNQLNIIDYYENNTKGIGHYATVLKDKGYSYGYHFPPHDIKHDDQFYEEGKTRLSIAAGVGINFADAVPKLSKQEGIEAARVILPRCWFAKTATKQGRQCLKQYRKEYDEKNKCFKEDPVHDWASHGADAFRYLALSADRTTAQATINYDELYA